MASPRRSGSGAGTRQPPPHRQTRRTPGLHAHPSDLQSGDAHSRRRSMASMRRVTSHCQQSAHNSGPLTLALIWRPAQLRPQCGHTILTWWHRGHSSAPTSALASRCFRGAQSVTSRQCAGCSFRRSTCIVRSAERTDVSGSVSSAPLLQSQNRAPPRRGTDATGRPHAGVVGAEPP